MTELSRVLVVGKHPVSHTQCSMDSEWRLSKSNLSLRCWDLGQKREHIQVNEVNRKSQGTDAPMCFNAYKFSEYLQVYCKALVADAVPWSKIIIIFSVIYIVLP